MRCALLGTGMVAEYHRRAIEAASDLGARLAAVGHHDRSRFRVIGERFGVPCRAEDDLLADPDIDAVVVCTPSGQHARQTIRAASAGKHVLVEKPMALSLADADRMVDACRSAGVTLGVVLQRRTESLSKAIYRAVTSGALGRPTLGVVTMPYFRPQSYYDQAAWRGTWELDGGGVLMNQGIHLVDLLIWWLGDPVSVRALGGTLERAIDVEDTVGAVLQFDSGATATIAATTTAEPGFPHRLELYGTGGCIQVEGDRIIRWSLSGDPDHHPETPPAASPAPAGSAADPRGISAEGHAAVLRDFISAVQEGRAPLVDGTEGRRSVSAVLQIYQAAGWRPLANPLSESTSP